MAIQSSGQVSLDNVRTELGVSGEISLGSLRLGSSPLWLVSLDNGPLQGITQSIPNLGNRGYIAGGRVWIYAPQYSNEIEGIEFNTSVLININAVLQVERYYLAGVNSSTKGYFAGGNNLSTSGSLEIDGILFSTETTINPSASLVLGRNSLDGVNSSSKGYFAGGQWIPSKDYITVTEIDGILFSTEAAHNPSAGLAVSRKAIAGVQSNSRGYFAGGGNSNDSSFYSEIDGINFDTDAAVNPSSTLNLARAAASGVTYPALRGYFAGGYYYASKELNMSNEIDGITFSTEAAHNPSATLSLARYSIAGTNSFTRGYFAGGGTSFTAAGFSSEIDGIIFSPEAAVNPSASLKRGRVGPAGVQSPPFSPEPTIALSNLYGFSVLKGYFAGGYRNSTSSPSSEIDTLVFSTQGSYNPSATLAVARDSLAGVNSSTKGYFAGGVQSLSEIDGIVFSTDAAHNPTATLPLARSGLTGVSSLIKGYFAGGVNSLAQFTSEIDGIVFSTEATHNPSVALQVARDKLAGVSSYQNGIFAGGTTASFSSEVDGVFFGNDTLLNYSSVLAVARSGPGGVNSLTKGYFGGGVVAAFTGTTEIDAISLVNGVASNPSATLAVSRYMLAGVNSFIRGYFGGGYTGVADSSEIDGITFDTEAAFNPSATLAVARYLLAGVQSGYL